MTTPQKTLPRRRASIAALLSLFAAGVGQVYAGRTVRGLVIFALALSAFPVMFLCALLPPSGVTLWLILGISAGAVGVGLFAVVDAARCAALAPDPYIASPANHAPFYLLLVFVGTLWVPGGVALVRTYAFEAFRIPTESMRPTLVPGDRILVNKLRAGDIDRGDLVVFREPVRGRNYIKRIVGLAGDTVEIDSDGVRVNGRPLADPDAGPTETGEVVEETGSGRRYHVLARSEEELLRFEVPPGQVFLLGDNRRGSADSRTFGPVPAAQVLGIAEYVYGSRFGRVR